MATGNGLLKLLTENAWLLRQDKLEVLRDIALGYANGQFKGMSFERDDNSDYSSVTIDGQVAVMNIEGILVNKASYLDAMCGFASTSGLREDFNALVANPKIKRIVMKFASPGGSVTGIQELAEDIYQARGQKEIVGFCDDMSCSASYWLMSACEQIVCEPSSEIANIGTYIMLQKKGEQANGSKVYIIQAGTKKTYGSPDLPVSEAELEYFQTQVNQVNERFLSSVARNRNVSTDEVRDLQGAFFAAQDSPKWLYDYIGNFNMALNG
jgi:ClpP class serine protease